MNKNFAKVALWCDKQTSFNWYISIDLGWSKFTKKRKWNLLYIDTENDFQSDKSWWEEAAETNWNQLQCIKMDAQLKLFSKKSYLDMKVQKKCHLKITLQSCVHVKLNLSKIKTSVHRNVLHHPTRHWPEKYGVSTLEACFTPRTIAKCSWRNGQTKTGGYTQCVPMSLCCGSEHRTLRSLRGCIQDVFAKRHVRHERV